MPNLIQLTLDYIPVLVGGHTADKKRATRKNHQYSRVPRLCREMQLLADVRSLPDDLQDLVRKVFRVRRREPDPHFRIHLGHFLDRQEIKKSSSRQSS